MAGLGKPFLAGFHEVLRPLAVSTLGNPLTAALLRNAVFSAKPIQYDPALFLG
jgi:hypothetical protein